MKTSNSILEPDQIEAPLLFNDHKAVTVALFAREDVPYLVADEPSTPSTVVDTAKPRPWWVVPLKALVFISIWWTAAILVIVEIKRTVSPGGVFQHPFAFTSFTQPVTGLMALLVSKAVHRRRPRPKSLTRREILCLVVMGGIQGVEIGLTNKALEYLTVAARTMISSTNVLFMMATAWLWGLENLGLLRTVSGALLVAGGTLQSYDQEQIGMASSLLGIGMQVVSMLLSSQRWALCQFVMHRSPPDSGLGQLAKLQLLARTLPITGLVCIPMALAFEPQAYSWEAVLQKELFHRVLIVSLALTGMLYAELQLVYMLSAVAFNVLATVHQIPIVLAGVILQHNQVGEKSTYGFSCCLAGALVYALARHVDIRAAARAAAAAPAPRTPMSPG